MVLVFFEDWRYAGRLEFHLDVWYINLSSLFQENRSLVAYFLSERTRIHHFLFALLELQLKKHSRRIRPDVKTLTYTHSQQSLLRRRNPITMSQNVNSDSPNLDNSAGTTSPSQSQPPETQGTRTSWTYPPPASLSLLQNITTTSPSSAFTDPKSELEGVVTRFLRASVNNTGPQDLNQPFAKAIIETNDEVDFKFNFLFELDGKGEGSMGRKRNETEQEVDLLCLFCDEELKEEGDERWEEGWGVCNNCKNFRVK